MPAKKKAYIGLGSNMGERPANIDRAMSLMAECPNIKVGDISALVETEPVGGLPQGQYLNGAAEIETELDARKLLAQLQHIELLLGRKRDVRWGPRTIDLDILLYGEEIIEDEDLIIPHPRMHERLFVLLPLCEIAPGARHPKLEKTVQELLDTERNRRL